MAASVNGRTVAVARCRACQAPIIWTVTVHGKRQPIDAEPSPDGNIELRGWAETEYGVVPRAVVVDPNQGGLLDASERWLPHHATCPEVEQFRHRAP